MRDVLPGEGTLLCAGKVYKITDKTPQESLSMKKRTMGQFFRIVTSDVSIWFRDHYTANPLGVLPDPNITEIVAGNMFSEEGLEILTDWKEEGHTQKKKVEEKYLKMKQKWERMGRALLWP